MQHARFPQSQFFRHLTFGFVTVFLALFSLSCSGGNDAADDAPESIAFSAETVEAVEALWIDAGATPPLAVCYSDVLRDAGALAEPVETMSDLAAAHESLSAEEQENLDSCLVTVGTDDGSTKETDKK